MCCTQKDEMIQQKKFITEDLEMSFQRKLLSLALESLKIYTWQLVALKEVQTLSAPKASLWMRKIGTNSMCEAENKIVTTPIWLTCTLGICTCP